MFHSSSFLYSFLYSFLSIRKSKYTVTCRHLYVFVSHPITFPITKSHKSWYMQTSRHRTKIHDSISISWQPGHYSGDSSHYAKSRSPRDPQYPFMWCEWKERRKKGDLRSLFIAVFFYLLFVENLSHESVFSDMCRPLHVRTYWTLTSDRFYSFLKKRPIL